MKEQLGGWEDKQSVEEPVGDFLGNCLPLVTEGGASKRLTCSPKYRLVSQPGGVLGRL